MEGFISLLEAIDGVVWGPIMLTVLVGTGIYLTIRTRFLCWRNLGHAIGNTTAAPARWSGCGSQRHSVLHQSSQSALWLFAIVLRMKRAKCSAAR